MNLASIMAMHPDMLILDEPTSQLDPIAASDFLETVKKIIRDLGTTNYSYGTSFRGSISFC